MDIFTSYLNSAINWVAANPDWALVFTFFISFIESLAIIGSIVPGSVTMTGIGILAGRGLMPVDLTLLAGTLGAVAGDVISFLIGNIFRHRIITLWPFSRHPYLLKYGQNYFLSHGGKSVLIGRFIGPLRSIIPVIAGMMNMNRWKFLVANVISAIGWAFLYIMPGVLIGAASHELSTESATRLFIIIITILILMWLSSLSLRWLIYKIISEGKKLLNTFGKKLNNSRYFHGYINFFKAENDKHYENIMALQVFFLFFSLLFILISLNLNVVHKTIDIPIAYFFQTLNSVKLDYFFIFISVFCSIVAVSAVFFIFLYLSIYNHHHHFIRFWLSLTLCTVILGLTFNIYLPIENIELPLGIYIKTFYPSTKLALIVALLSFIIFLLKNSTLNEAWVFFIKWFFILLLILIGTSLLYLNQYWLSAIIASYCLGLALSFLHRLFYRRFYVVNVYTKGQIISFIGVLLFIALCSLPFTITKNLQLFSYETQTYIISDKLWLQHQKPLLPIYVKNRLGFHSALFNIEYAGDLKNFESKLKKLGWEEVQTNFLYNLAAKASGIKNNLPLFSPLYINLKPILVMVHKDGFVLSMWSTNYILQNSNTPIWLGNIQHNIKKFDANFDSFINVIPGVTIREVGLKNIRLKHVSKDFVAKIYLIKEN